MPQPLILSPKFGRRVLPKNTPQCLLLALSCWQPRELLAKIFLEFHKLSRSRKNPAAHSKAGPKHICYLNYDFNVFLCVYSWAYEMRIIEPMGKDAWCPACQWAYVTMQHSHVYAFNLQVQTMGTSLWCVWGTPALFVLSLSASGGTCWETAMLAGRARSASYWVASWIISRARGGVATISRPAENGRSKEGHGCRTIVFAPLKSAIDSR